MKFEKPIMNISYFAIENVITTSAPTPQSVAEDVKVGTIKLDGKDGSSEGQTMNILAFNW